VEGSIFEAWRFDGLNDVDDNVKYGIGSVSVVRTLDYVVVYIYILCDLNEHVVSNSSPSLWLTCLLSFRLWVLFARILNFIF
jgi:hypothetical protein